jgi:hypothetical protein
LYGSCLFQTIVAFSSLLRKLSDVLDVIAIEDFVSPFLILKFGVLVADIDRVFESFVVLLVKGLLVVGYWVCLFSRQPPSLGFPLFLQISLWVKGRFKVSLGHGAHVGVLK